MYKKLFEVLDNEGIRERGDLRQLKLEHTGMSRYVVSDDYPWIKDIFYIVRNAFTQLLKSFQTAPQPRITSERIFRLWGFTVDVLDPIFDNRGFYGCLFPKRVWFQSHQFVYHADGDLCFVPPDFLASLIALRPLLLANMAYLFPIRFKEFGLNDDYGYETLGTFHYRTVAKDLTTIPFEGKGEATLQKAIGKQGWSQTDVDLISIPRLTGARLEDYVEVAQTHPDEFTLYCSALKDFTSATAESPEQLVRGWAEKMQAGTARLNALFKAKQKELQWKGLEVASGLFCTAACLMLPPELKLSLAPILGVKSIAEGFTWLANYRNARDTLRAEPFWILWRIQN